MIKPKAQTATEFVFLIIIVFMVSLIFTVVSLNQERDINYQREFILLKDVGLKLQSEISIAAYTEDGYSRVFEIPTKLDIFDYNISIINSTFIFAESSNHQFITRIATVNGTVIKGNNIITKQNGNIKIN